MEYSYTRRIEVLHNKMKYSEFMGKLSDLNKQDIIVFTIRYLTFYLTNHNLIKLKFRRETRRRCV